MRWHFKIYWYNKNQPSLFGIISGSHCDIVVFFFVSVPHRLCEKFARKLIKILKTQIFWMIFFASLDIWNFLNHNFHMICRVILATRVLFFVIFFQKKKVDYFQMH